MHIKINDLEKNMLFTIFVIYTLFPNIIFGMGFIMYLGIWFIKNLKNRENLITAIFLILLFQISSKQYTTGNVYLVFEYLDELLEVLAILYILFKLIKKQVHLYKFEKIAIIGMSGFLLCGLISSIINKYQAIFPTLVDILTCIKFLVYYLATRIFLNDSNDFIYQNLNSVSRYISVICFILTIINVTTSLFYKKFDYRYFTESIQLFMPHPTYLAALCITIILILLMNTKKTKGNGKYFVLLSLVMIFTFRTKALIALVVVYFVYILVIKLKIKSVSILGIIIIFLALGMSSEQVDKYYGNSQTVRSRMTADGIELANEYFPLGTGFATYATSAAYSFKSPLYYKLGYFTNYWKEFAMGDTFWPGVFAQTGWIGTIFFILSISCFIISSVKNIRNNSLFFVCTISIMVYEIIASTAESAFFNPTAVPLFMLFAFLVSEKEDSKVKENKIKE